MSFISQINSDLKFGLGGTSYIYVNSGSTGAFSIRDYSVNPKVYLSIDSLNNKTVIPGSVGFYATNATIDYLTASNITGTNYFFTGPTGAFGAQGAQGFIGRQGLYGSQGSQGVFGAMGLQGRQGAQGRQGFQGFQNQLVGLQGHPDFNQPVLNRGNDRILTSVSYSTGVNAEANLTFNNNTLFVNNDVSATGLYIQSITGIGVSTGLIDSNYSINISHSLTDVYSIIDLENIQSKNGIETTLLNYQPTTTIIYNINTTGGTTYSTGTTTYSTSFVFYNGKWYISGNY
jgi:hypothetical protein